MPEWLRVGIILLGVVAVVSVITAVVSVITAVVDEWWKRRMK